MNSIESLRQDIERALPNVETKLRKPRKATGHWWLDATHNGHAVAVEWSPRHGFGISTEDVGDGYGEGPDEVFDDRDKAAKRVVELLAEGSRTAPPHEVVLRELRAALGFTQEQLANRLGVQQAAVSRLERRPDMTLGSLRRYVEALGGELEINVRTSGGERLRLLDTDQRAKVRTKINLLVLRVADLDASRAFYAALGLDLIPERHGKGPLHYSCTVQQTVMELYPCTEPSSEHNRLRFGFEAQKQVLERLLASGLLKQPPRIIRSQPRSEVYLVRDPDENSIELEVTA
jgi:transcriptional regulator with XRE-family HTH domain